MGIVVNRWGMGEKGESIGRDNLDWGRGIFEGNCGNIVQWKLHKICKIEPREFS